MTEKEQGIYDQLPRPPADAVFVLVRVQTMVDPHPYCITLRHVAEAADHHGGRLGLEAIAAAERKGARCGMEGCQLDYAEHRSELAAVIQVPRDAQRDLNGVPGLHAYLLELKPIAERLNITGFAFPHAGQL